MFEQWDNLSEDEKTYVVSNPTHVYYIKRDADIAIEEAKKRFSTGRHNGPGDAFRHCFWSAMLARDLGHADAILFTTAHESKPDNPADEREMDLWNNAVGLSIGQRLPNAPDETLAVAAMEALTSKKLKVITA